MRFWSGILMLLGGLGATVAAQAIPATGGNIQITPMTHAHVQVEFGGKVIHVDPTGQSVLTSGKPADLILVTDIHGDHMDQKAIDALKKPGTIVVAPQAVAGKLVDVKTEVMANGETKTVDGVQIEAVAGYNLVRGPKPGAFFHEKGRANAYVVTLGGRRVFFSGDTECVPEIKALTNIEVAFVTMNLPFTMPPEEAADCVKAFKPRIVYAYHYRGQGATPEDNLQAFVAAMKGTAGIEVRTPNFYANAVPAGPGGGRGMGAPGGAGGPGGRGGN